MQPSSSSHYAEFQSGRWKGRGRFFQKFFQAGIYHILVTTYWNTDGNFQTGTSEKSLSPMDPVQALFAPFQFFIMICQVAILHSNKNP